MYSEEDLEAYLDESLSLERAVELEGVIRNPAHPDQRELLDRLQLLIVSRDSGTHAIGEIWRRHRLSCPSREDLGRYLLEAMSDEEATFIKMHIEVVACEVCRSNLDDLIYAANQSNQSSTNMRRNKYFQSSVGRLRKQ
jgi:hypothetical protein